MSEAEACLWKNEFRGFALLKHRAFWAAGTLVIFYKVVLVLKNKCPDSRPPCGTQTFGLSVFFISCGLGHRPCLRGQLLKLQPQLAWTRVPHPNKEAKKHMKWIWARSRTRWRETMWLFYSTTGLIHPPLHMYRHPVKYWVASLLLFEIDWALRTQRPQDRLLFSWLLGNFLFPRYSPSGETNYLLPFSAFIKSIM